MRQNSKKQKTYWTLPKNVLRKISLIKQVAITLVLICSTEAPTTLGQSASESNLNQKLSADQAHSNSIAPDIKASIISGLSDVGTVTRPTSWDRFRVFVWQYKTDAKRDEELYQRAGLFSFHVDRGVGQEKKIEWAIEQNRPYYIDHAAGKGILHMTERSGLGKIRNDGSLQSRPQSLISKASIKSMTDQLSANMEVAGKGPVAAIALDDEVSLGTFNTPMEVDASPESTYLFQLWLRQRYGSIKNLNQQWATDYSSFDSIKPIGFETVRLKVAKQPFSRWNLSPWIDWRSYMDSQFASTLAHLVRYTNKMTPNVPAGIVGGQQPSPFGGFDYSKISKSVQWIESYDIGGTNELLTSFWHDSRRPIVQTFFATGDPRRDHWFLWYYWAHGNSACIAWPDINGKAWFEKGRLREEIETLEPSFRQLQTRKFSMPSDPKSKLEFDPIAILYSHPSVQLSWATDALVHGKTWPRRSSSLDNNCSSAGKNRIAWNKLLEDCGFQPRWISVEQLESDELTRNNLKALILPRTLALGKKSCEAIKRFHQGGGCVIADHWTGIFDEHGKAYVENGRLKGGLDDLFKLSRDEKPGYFDGKTRTEVNGELYNRPFLERLPKYSLPNNGFPKVEIGTTGGFKTETALSERDSFRVADQAFYLNSSPSAYSDSSVRLSDRGNNWRHLISSVLKSANIQPKIVAWKDGKPIPMVELLSWKNGNRRWIIVVSNPTRAASVNGAGKSDWASLKGEVVLKFSTPHFGGFDVRTGTSFKEGDSITIQFDAKSATVLEMAH